MLRILIKVFNIKGYQDHIYYVEYEHLFYVISTEGDHLTVVWVGNKDITLYKKYLNNKCSKTCESFCDEYIPECEYKERTELIRIKKNQKKIYYVIKEF